MAQIRETFLFQPTSVPGCQLWLDGADPNGNGVSPVNGASVSTWTDKSGNGRSPTGASAPTFVTNTGVYFNGTRILTGSFFANTTTGANFFIVVTPQSLSGRQRFVFLATTNGYGGLFDNNAMGPVVGGTYYDYAPGLSTNVRYILSGNTLSSGTIVGAKDGTDLSSPTTYGGNANRFEIGNDSGNNVPFIGFIHEILYYDAVFTTLQRQQIEGYLAWKWGIQASLPSNHPFRTYRPLAQQPFPTQIPPMPTVNQGIAIYTPTQIASGCVLWLDGADSSSMALSGSVITTWRDKSGQGNNATAFNSPTLSGSNVTMNGTNQYFTCPNASYRPCNIFCVATYTGSGEGTLIRKGFSTGVSYEFGISVLTTTGLRYEIRTSGGGQINVNSTVSSSSGIQLYEMTYDNTTGIAYFNGTSLGSGNATGPVFSGSTPLFLGAYSGDGGGVVGGYLSGSFQEFIIYTTTPTTAQRQQIEGYLAWKWGFAAKLPEGHPYKQQPIAPFPARVSAFNGTLNQWIPTRISGCTLWLDAADTSSLSLSGTSVTRWNDKSGNGNNAQQGTLANSPTFSASNISFNGSQWLTTPITSAPTTESFFIVLNTTRNDSIDVFAGTSVGVREVLLFGTNLWIGSYGTAPSTGTNGGVISTNTRLQFNYQYTTSLLTFSVNGSVTGSGTPPFTYSGSGTSFIGSSTFSPNNFVGTMNEIVYYNTSLSPSQRQQVEGYLAWKWGLQGSLPATHPFKIFPPPP